MQVWLATGHTDMRKGFDGLALMVQEDAGGRRAAAVYTLIETAKLNDTDPRAWLADVLARLPDYPAKRIGELLPWNWKPHNAAAAAA
jgi:transposase